MGFFTYRQAKKGRREVEALRRDQAAAADRELVTSLFQQLPPEGKAELREVEEECRPRWSDGGLQIMRKQKKLAAGRAEVFRRYDLIP